MAHIDHIGIAVNDLDAATAFFRDTLKLPHKETKELPERGLKIAFFQVGETLVELLSPLNESSQVSKFLATRGEGIHHMAISTPDIQASIQGITAAGVRMATPEVTLGAEGRPIAFLHPKGTFGVLLELIQK
jgi:methylmalonyl-CoA/ethylmalonyl-CoA epimerase